MSEKFGILFVSDSNFIPFAIRSIDSFCKFHENFDIFLGLVGASEKDKEMICENIDLGGNRLFFMESLNPAGITTRDWAATRRANFAVEIFESRIDLSGVLYFDVDYIFHDKVADLIASADFDFVLRSSVNVRRDLATAEQIENSLGDLPGDKIETPVWSGRGHDHLDINSGLIWIKNCPKNLEILREWERLMMKENYVWFSDQNNLRLVLQHSLEKGLIKWKPVDRSLYSRFFHEKGPGKLHNLETFRKKYAKKIS